MTASPEFRAFLENAAKTFPTKAAFAKRLGMTPGRFSRVLGGEHSLSVTNCLVLADFSGEPASRVLRLAGKADVAELLERLYGKNRPNVSASQKVVLDLWDKLRQPRRQIFLTLLQELVEKDAAHDRTKRA